MRPVNQLSLTVPFLLVALVLPPSPAVAAKAAVCFREQVDLAYDGTSGDDRFLGLSAWDVMIGRRGNDLLMSGSGNDRICGRAGSDVLIGGLGKDLLNGGPGIDICSGEITFRCEAGLEDDTDNDGRPNMDEIRKETDPFVAQDAPVLPQPDVSIPAPVPTRAASGGGGGSGGGLNQGSCLTDPTRIECDPDGDGLSNADENLGGSDPTDICNPLQAAGQCDPDADGLSNADENLGGSDPTNSCDPLQAAGQCDPDGDGLSNAVEIAGGSDPTDPCDPDASRDGCADPDTDSDGLTDYDEIDGTFGYITDPNLADTDDDGLTDFEEVNATFGSFSDPTNVCDPDTSKPGCPDDPEGGVAEVFECQGLLLPI